MTQMQAAFKMNWASPDVMLLISMELRKVGERWGRKSPR